MDIVPALPLDLLAVAAPQSGAPSGVLRLGDTEGDDAAPLLPFDALLAQLLADPPPAGESLPETGNGLPLLPAGLPLPGVPAPYTPEPQPMASAAPPPFALGAQGLPFAAPVPDAALSPPQTSALGARPMEWSSSTAAGEQALPNAEQLAAVVDGATTGDADAAPAVAADRFSLPPAAESPDARPVQAMPAALDAELTQSQPAGRVLAALAAAAAAPTERGTARATKPAPAGAERVAVPVGAERTTVALDAPRDAAPLPRALELPQPVVASDASLAAIDNSRSGESRLPTTPTLAVDAAAPSAAFGQAHAPSAGSAAAPAAPAHAPVAHPDGSVDTTAARWHDALASRIQWVVDHDVGEARIKLNPPELGALDVKISLQDDKTFVQLTAHSSAARDELTQSLPRLRELLSANGLELGGATVSGGRDQRPAPYAQAEGSIVELDAAGPIATSELRRASASSQIDVFA